MTRVRGLDAARGLALVGMVVAHLDTRIDFDPGAVAGATFRYCCEGWGLVRLIGGAVVSKDELQWSHTTHNTEKRALAWTATLPELGDPAAWNWPAVTSASNRLNRIIRRTAVGKIGSHPVMPHAAQHIADTGLQYEYGMGVHRTRAPT